MTDMIHVDVVAQRELSLRRHLKTINPTWPTYYVGVAEEAIAAVEAGEDDFKITMPGGRTVTAGNVISAFSLSGFVGGDDD
jgi:hypothetical protein